MTPNKQALPDFAFPLLCFTTDGDIWSVRDSFELTTCGPETLAEGLQLGMLLVDVAGSSWKVRSVTHVGYPPLSRRSWRLLGPRLHLIEHELEPVTPLSLEEVQDRICAALDAYPLYWCEPSETDTVLVERKAEVRRAQSIGEIHDLLGLDAFG